MILHVDGVDLHYETWGEGEPLLWLHGALGLGADWRYVFSEPPAGYRIVAPDLRGHGSSGGGVLRQFFRQSAIDVVALIDHMRLEHVKIVGVSGGGVVALHVATMQPGRVTAMVVASAPARFPERARAIQRSYSEAMVPSEELLRMRERHSRPGQLAALFEQVRAFAEGDDPDFTSDELRRVSADTLIVFGDRDPLYPVQVGVDLYTAMPRAALWVVPRGGHGPVFGAYAPRFVEVTLQHFQAAGS